MEEDKNPILEQENYFKEYQKNIDDLKNKPEIIEFDKLTYEVFGMNEQGKRWLELVKERYVIPGLARLGTPTYQIDVIWGEGLKEFPRLIMSALKSHQQRIAAGK